jgi:hypothetical protein
MDPFTKELKKLTILHSVNEMDSNGFYEATGRMIYKSARIAFVLNIFGLIITTPK